MKRFGFVLVLAALLCALIPSQADAMPRKFKNCPTTKQDGITYRLWDRCAIVERTPNRKNITIPNSIRYKNKTYRVTAIWDGTFYHNSALRNLNIKATNLECIEDGAIFKRRYIKVTVHDRGTYNWLKRGGVNVTLKR